MLLKKVEQIKDMNTQKILNHKRTLPEVGSALSSKRQYASFIFVLTAKKINKSTENEFLWGQPPIEECYMQILVRPVYNSVYYLFSNLRHLPAVFMNLLV